MVSHAPPYVGTPFQRNPFLRRLALAHGVVWLWAAIAPWDRQTWLRESLLVLAAVALLAATHRRFVFSNLSYLLIAVFLSLHVVGSHFSYSAVPLGAWAQQALGGALFAMLLCARLRRRSGREPYLEWFSAGPQEP